MSKITKQNEIKTLCEKILNYKLHDANDSKLPTSSGKKSGVSKNASEEIKITLNKINNLLKKGPNLSKNQKDIFVFLSDKGLEKLTDMIRMDDIEISKLSFLCLLNLLYKNEVLINIYCEKYGFNPVGNVICINWLPKIFEEKISLSLEVLQDIQESAENYKQNTKYWKWPNNTKYTDSNLPDPHKYLLGFIHKENEIFMNNNSSKQKGGPSEKKLSKYEQEAIEILEEDE